ncbi:MAG: hypothetical protein IKV03_05095 [Alphaproteobacteria bacterium]|nr:hypothetical protein [Alphaproteobacteria bacterium]
MKSPILYQLSEIKELYDAFKEFVRTKGFYDECMDSLKKYNTSFFKLVIKNNKTKKTFKIRKNDFLGRSGTAAGKPLTRPTVEAANFYRAWVKNNAQQDLTPTKIMFKKKSINLIGNTDQSFKNARIFLSDNALILPKTGDERPLKEVPAENPHAIEELVYLAEAYDEFISTYNGAKKQENFDAYFKNNFLVKVITPYFRQSMAEPIIKMMEQTRRLLIATLLEHFKVEISTRQHELNDTNSPEAFLKNNKDEIFMLSQKVGIIDDAQKLIKLHQLRNDLAHPDINMDVLVDVPETVNDIYETTFNFIRRITTTKNLTIQKVSSIEDADDLTSFVLWAKGRKIEDRIPIIEKSKDIETPILIHAMQCLDIAFQSAAPVDANGKALKGKKQREWLVNEGMMDVADKQDYETAKNLRNAVCHGNATSQTHTDIIASNSVSQHLTEKIIQNMKQKGRNRI